jgi:hypothetical protein
MKKNSVIDFYLQVVSWIFLCLVLAGFYNDVKAVIMCSFSSDNEVAAAQMIRSIQKLQVIYAQKHAGKYAPNFDELIKIGALDELFAGEKPLVQGYVFKMKVSEPTGEKPAFYSITADPKDSEGFIYTGKRHFYSDSTWAMKVTEQNRQANPSDASF